MEQTKSMPERILDVVGKYPEGVPNAQIAREASITSGACSSVLNRLKLRGEVHLKDGLWYLGNRRDRKPIGADSERGIVKQKVVNFLRVYPGSTSGDIGRFLWPDKIPADAGDVASKTLYGYIKRAQPDIVRKWDDKEKAWRYYLPHQLKQARPGELPGLVEPPPPTIPLTLVVAAKEFVWETNSNNLRDFIKWYEEVWIKKGEQE